jgi:SAM-dependent methyltransferase
MREASKTRRVRNGEFYERFLRGRVLDIGCGDDLVVPQAEPFDRPQGDANRITEFLPPGIMYDCVHSSHCLEHTHDVPRALREWWSLVKPGGYLIIVVPHEDLYEQGVWPSIFNRDHKATFRVGGESSWSPVSYDIVRLVENLPGAHVISVETQDDGYDYTKRRMGLPAGGRLLVFLRRLRMAALRRLGLARLELAFQSAELWLGLPMDQTLGDALAQIQVVAMKVPEAAEGRGAG